MIRTNVISSRYHNSRVHILNAIIQYRAATANERLYKRYVKPFGVCLPAVAEYTRHNSVFSVV